ncbi:MAG: type II toxin-antitoxin system Phd/YefM family antitoxin [Jatrophihabitantaceae bacterium]
MDSTISQRELRYDSGVIMRRVEQGESLTVTRNLTPVADQVPHNRDATDRRPRFDPVDVIAAGLENAPEWGS